MRANTWYAFVGAPAKMLYKQLGPLGCLFMIFPLMGFTGLAVGVAKGTIPWRHVAGGIGGVGLFAIIIVVLARIRAKAGFVRALQHPSPDALIAIYARSIAPAFPDGDAHRAYLSAIGCAMYGDFDRARAFLAAVDWAARVPGIQAGAFAAEAWIAYLGRRDGAVGVEYARKARELSGVMGVSAPAGSNLLETVGRALLARPRPGDEGVLRESAAGGAPLDRPLAAWALAVVAHRAGRADERDALLAAVRRDAPHCGPLLRVE